jgi:indole-3-acetate monooxygenase
MSDAATVGGVAAAHSLRDLTAQEAPLSEEARTLTAREVEALWESGLMQWANPKAAAGSEPSLTEMIDTWIELAWQDGSVGWVGIANFPSAAVCAAYLPD